MQETVEVGTNMGTYLGIVHDAKMSRHAHEAVLILVRDEERHDTVGVRLRRSFGVLNFGLVIFERDGYGALVDVVEEMDVIVTLQQATQVHRLPADGFGIEDDELEIVVVELASVIRDKDFDWSRMDNCQLSSDQCYLQADAEFAESARYLRT